MSIVPLYKVTLVGRDSRRERVLIELQDLGCMHLIDLAANSRSKGQAHPLAMDLRAALRYLDACPAQRPAAASSVGYDPQTVVQIALKNEEELRNLLEERRELREAIERLEPWGEFQLPTSDELAGQQLWFYRARHRQAEAFARIDLPARKVASDTEFEYWLVIGPQEPQGLPVAHLALGTRRLSELRQAHECVNQRLDQLEVERIALTRWSKRLRAEVAAADDLALRLEAARRTVQDESLFALQGWIPVSTVTVVQEYAQRNKLALTVENPRADETPPTLLRNPQAVAGAESAVTFYVTPGYRSWDPTWIMYFSFSLFFAMIMADAGYGIALGIPLLTFYRRLGATTAYRRLRALAAFMVAMTIGYGVIIGSYFGTSPNPGSWLDKLVWKSGGKSIMEDREAMMLLAASIGVAHLAIANIIAAWQHRGSGRAISHVGWAVALVSGLVMAVSKLPKPALLPWLAEQSLFAGKWSAQSLAEQLWQAGTLGLIAGLLCVFLFASARPVFSTRISDWLWRPIDGLLALTNLSKAFGDALSYLRLFALGLASAQLAITFNDLASHASEVKGVGLLLGTLIFLVGHSLNLVLGIVGGVVHGLRLNCIEFFSWSLTDEGIPFQAFSKKASS